MNNQKSKQPKPMIELVDLVKTFDQSSVLKKLNLSIKKGEFITLLGASGSGKTTALRLIGGFEKPTRGEIIIKGVDMKDLPAHKRPTRTIFQDYALFPHLSVLGNIKYGLKLIRVPKPQVSPRILQKKAKLIQTWTRKAQNKMAQLDREQAEYETIIRQQKSKSTNYRKAQKWLDKSDFVYSYWESFVDQKIENFEKMYTTRALKPKEMQTKALAMIELVGLSQNEQKRIDQLSGGMKQRVALARALVTEPEILLLDEPLSALDLKVRQKMQKELRNIQKKLGLTFVFVTHDQEEAMTISDRIAILRDGKIEQFDTPQKIYEYPINSWVADFIGASNLFQARVIGKNKIMGLGLELPGDTYDFPVGKKVFVMLRPEDLTISARTKGFINGQIISAIFQGTFWEYVVQAQKMNWKVKTTKKYQLKEKVSLKWKAYDVHTMGQ